MSLRQLHSSLVFGGDYNPEQWPRELWAEDMRLMKEAGVNLVSIAVFSWARLQPSEKRYDFSELDAIMDLLAAHGIYACLATATASPPAWLSTAYPDVLAVDAQGNPFYHGSRQHYSPFSPSYRRFAAALVRRLAERYARHPALALWHINNEYGNHIQECHSLTATQAFRRWLRRKYGSLSALNEAWGTCFWSQAYGAWTEIFTPRRTPFTPNPAQQLDFKRFMSGAFQELLVLERDILRELSPEVPVTTNLMGFHKPIDGFSWAPEMDVVSWNSYPDPAPGARGEYFAAAGHDLVRSLRKDRPFFLMEQAAAGVYWQPSTATKAPGIQRLLTLQAIARGSDAAMFFQWRSSRVGAEKYMTGMVPHIPPEKSRVFSEIKATGANLAALAPVKGSRIRSKVAIVFDWNCWWAVELEAKPARFDYLEAVRSVHRYFYEHNIAVDFVHPSENLAAYDLVVAPLLYLLGEKEAASLDDFVKNGGTLLVTSFSGIVDENEQVLTGGYPARLRSTLGLWVEEWVPYQEPRGNRLRFSTGKKSTHPCSQWCEVLHLEGARSLASFEMDFFAGQPAITRNSCGKGRAFYLATRLDESGLDQLLDLVCKEASVAPLLKVPAGVEASLRENGDKRFLFLINHRNAPVILRLNRLRGTDLLTRRKFRGESVALDAHGVIVLQLSTPKTP